MLAVAPLWRLWLPVGRKLAKKCGVRVDDASDSHNAVAYFADKLQMTC